jgi:hypothetical protein
MTVTYTQPDVTAVMSQAEIVERLKAIHENARALARSGHPGMEPRAAEIMAISHATLWSEAPFDVINVLVDDE